MTDDGGVLGNLPRSRPGQRSEKRTERTASAPSKTAGPSKKPAGARRSAAASPGQPATDVPPREPGSHAGDPVGDAIRTVTGVAATGARVAGGVAREVLRRLPRP